MIRKILQNYQKNINSYETISKKILLMQKNDKNGDLETLNTYFKDINKMDVNLLTPEEEVELAKRIQLGDDKAIKEIVEANLKFVVSIAHEYKNKGLSLNDLVNEGNYGLIKAAKRFDHTRGFKFISYAVWWVRQSILQSLNDNARTIRLPVNVLNKIYQLRKEFNFKELDGESLPNEEVEYINSLPKCTASLNNNINEDGDELLELFSDEMTNYDENKGLDDDMKYSIMECLEILNEREKDIVINYFGLFHNQPSTLEQIGNDHDLTKERVRQIKSKAIKKLKYNVIPIIKNI